jgi:hypothetical protein
MASPTILPVLTILSNRSVTPVRNSANNGVPKVDGKERLKLVRIAAAAQLAEEEAKGSDEDPDGY